MGQIIAYGHRFALGEVVFHFLLPDALDVSLESGREHMLDESHFFDDTDEETAAVCPATLPYNMDEVAGDEDAQKGLDSTQQYDLVSGGGPLLEATQAYEAIQQVSAVKMHEDVPDLTLAYDLTEANSEQPQQQGGKYSPLEGPVEATQAYDVDGEADLLSVSEIAHARPSLLPAANALPMNATQAYDDELISVDDETPIPPPLASANALPMDATQAYDDGLVSGDNEAPVPPSPLASANALPVDATQAYDIDGGEYESTQAYDDGVEKEQNLAEAPSADRLVDDLLMAYRLHIPQLLTGGSPQEGGVKDEEEEEEQEEEEEEEDEGYALGKLHSRTKAELVPDAAVEATLLYADAGFGADEGPTQLYQAAGEEEELGEKERRSMGGRSGAIHLGEATLLYSDPDVEDGEGEREEVKSPAQGSVGNRSQSEREGQSSLQSTEYDPTQLYEEFPEADDEVNGHGPSKGNEQEKEEVGEEGEATNHERTNDGNATEQRVGTAPTVRTTIPTVYEATQLYEDVPDMEGMSESVLVRADHYEPTQLYEEILDDEPPKYEPTQLCEDVAEEGSVSAAPVRNSPSLPLRYPIPWLF